MTVSRKAALLALAAVIAVWTWQFLTVRYNYGGNWTALFLIRPGMPVPEFLKSEKLYIFQNSAGYDGQVYHLIAHDPWMRKGSREAIAGASFRYQRILVPALAWALALGRDAWVDRAYYAVILAFLFAGVYWMALLAARAGWNQAWGLAFVLLPATLVSIDRMTADIALAAFVAGFALYAGKVHAGWVALLLACAALTRETALPVIAGYTGYLLTRREIRNAILIACSALPAIGWFIYLNRMERSPVASFGGWIPLAGFIERVAHPAVYALSGFKGASAQAFDYLALAGIALALALAACAAVRREWSSITSAMYAMALAAVFLHDRSVWVDVYAFGRVLTPLLLLAAMVYWRKNRWLALAPVFLVDSRVALNFAAQLQGVARALLK